MGLGLSERRGHERFESGEAGISGGVEGYGRNFEFHGQTMGMRTVKQPIAAVGLGW